MSENLFITHLFIGLTGGWRQLYLHSSNFLHSMKIKNFSSHTVYGCSLITKAERASNCGDLVVRLSAESDSEETLKLFYGVFA